ncbi:hypothetical protein MSG28_001820 [Choristoneura fumiferana]|uniref:Uncharacterized protein n=1 Tax=Choristoneura fumiferana TaxID=7141 RepID=A0ACC0KVN8_CHOFU|nr:hypothetical protein MSG28_001820 [Choristoneura fumiferana]
MTATATQVSQRAAISEKEWTKIFPKNVTENYTGSITFIKQLTLVSVSMITYLKNAFPEESYSTESFGGIPLKLLNSRCSDDLAQFVSTALQQAWEAFDKKYAENLIEYHIFEYTYSANDVSLNINSKSRSSEQRSLQISLESVKNRTIMLIRMVYVYMTQNGLEELPLNYDVSLRLYYNDDAPEGYQPPGFCSNKAPDHLEPTLPEALRLGWVETPFHKLAVGSYVRGMFPSSEEAVASENAPAMTQNDNLECRSKTSVADPSEGSVEIQLRCQCNRFDVPTDLATLITCQYCLTQQHAVCFGFLSHAPKDHCCAACYDEDPRRKCSDPKLVALDQKRRECLSICRRTLELCSQLSAISGQMLMEKFGLSATSGRKMIKLLHAHYVVPLTADDDLSAPRKINPIRLKLAFRRFFHAEDMEEDTVVDRLVAETETTETSDPIGEVLSPLEKITLRNSSNLGQIIENSVESTNHTRSDDKTLQQYREAVLTNQDITEELPLSGSHNPVKDIENIGRKKSKRKNDDDDEWTPKLRSGAKTKKARTST